MQLQATSKLAVSSFHSLWRRVWAGMEGEKMEELLILFLVSVIETEAKFNQFLT